MADPRNVDPSRRTAKFSRLMRMKNDQRRTGQIANACPFGCEDRDLDDHGYCGHLVGFTNGGKFYEPRLVRKEDGRVITTGARKKPMEKGMVLVQITTSARVYSPNVNERLIVKRITGEDEANAIAEEEAALLRRAEAIRNPVLEGPWEGTAYDAPVQTLTKTAPPG